MVDKHLHFGIDHIHRDVTGFFFKKKIAKKNLPCHTNNIPK